MNKINLEGRVAIVTGGAQGLGLFIVERLAADGAIAIARDRDKDRLAATEHESAAVDVTDAQWARRPKRRPAVMAASTFW